MIVAGQQSRQALIDAGDRPLVWDEDGGWRSASDLLRTAHALARALADRDLGGRRVGLWMWNSAATLEAHLAIEWIGATRVPVDPSAAAPEAQAVFDAASVDTVLVDGAHTDVLTDALVHDPEQRLAASGAVEPVQVDPDSTLLLYSRMAVAGELLAVPMSHRNWLAHMDLNLRLLREGWYGPPLGEDDLFVTAQQVMHATGIVGTFPFLHAGLPQVVLRSFDADAFIDAVERHDATSTFFVPGMVSRVADAVRADNRALGLRRMLYGGAPFPITDLKAAVSAIGPALVQLYGRFEGGWPLTVLGVDEHDRIADGEDKLGASCGRAVPGVELDIRHVGEAGELRVKGPTVVREYADPDGWCALGDVVTLDEDYYYLHGRLDGMINTGSYHVYPAEVEQAITAVSGVDAVRVRGEDDPVWGQAVTAYVAGQTPLGEDELRQSLRQHIAAYKIPKRIHFVDRLP
jgi:acyl-CoA synthetase (AMP-forming)/AMP-acid ligase II